VRAERGKLIQSAAIGGGGEGMAGSGGGMGGWESS
jgi:hypothetical protein